MRRAVLLGLTTAALCAAALTAWGAESGFATVPPFMSPELRSRAFWMCVETAEPLHPNVGVGHFLEEAVRISRNPAAPSGWDVLASFTLPVPGSVELGVDDPRPAPRERWTVDCFGREVSVGKVGEPYEKRLRRTVPWWEVQLLRLRWW